MKNKKVIFIITIIFLIVCGLIGYISYINSPPVKAQRQLNLGNKYLAELDYEQAIVAYEAAIEIEPMNIDAYFGLIEAHIGLGDWNSALEISLKGYENTHNEELKVKADEIQAELDKIAEEQARAEAEERRKQAEAEWRSQYDLIVEADNGWHCFVERVYSDEEKRILNNLIQACENNAPQEIMNSGISSLYVEDEYGCTYMGVLFGDYALELYIGYYEDENYVINSCNGNIYSLVDGKDGYSFNVDDFTAGSQEFIKCPCVNGYFDGELSGIGYYNEDNGYRDSISGIVKKGRVICGERRAYMECCEFLEIGIADGHFYERVKSYGHSDVEHITHVTKDEETYIGKEAQIDDGQFVPNEDSWNGANVFFELELEEMFAE